MIGRNPACTSLDIQAFGKRVTQCQDAAARPHLCFENGWIMSGPQELETRREAAETRAQDEDASGLTTTPETPNRG